MDLMERVVLMAQPGGLIRSTVKRRVTSILQKLGAHDRCQAIRLAHQMGLSSPD